MDDLIVVILTLAVAGIGILGQFKKKKQQAAGTSQPKQPESFWDLIQGETKFPAQEESSDYYDEENVEPVISPVTSNQKINTAHKKPFVKKDEFVKKSIRKKVKSKTMESFSLRKAVIYSEILNRKYT
jgi:hypothetical protein